MKLKLPVILPTLLAVATLTLLAAEKTDHPVDQKDKDFSKTEITIKPGDSLTFKNSDSVTHNVFSNSKVNPFTIKIQKPGESSTIEFKDAGVTEVRCAIHPKMKIVVTVKE